MNPLAARSLLIAVVTAVAACGMALALRDRGDRPRASSGTFVPSLRGERAVLWAVGDGADGAVTGRAVAARIARGSPDRMLYLGDVYGDEGARAPDGTAADFRDHYDALYGELASRTAPTPGNHEWPARRQGYNPYWRRVHGEVRPYYSFAAGGWRVLSLNSEAPHGVRSAQVRWLRGQLRRRGTCRLAFWHRPRFSAGPHGDQRDVAPLWNALRGRAVLVVSGHDHDMQRLHPVNGITQLVSGAGGHGHYALRAADRQLAFGNDRDYGALRIVLRPGRAKLGFVTADGRVLDRHTVECRMR
jgi:Calcineurin-like phosphoesterase